MRTCISAVMGRAVHEKNRALYRVAGLLIILIFCVVTGGNAAPKSGEDQKALLGAIEIFSTSYEKKDIPGIMTIFAQEPDIVVITAVKAMRARGYDEVKKAFTQEFATFEGVRAFQTRELAMAVRGAIAAVTAVYSLVATATGKPLNLNGRLTAVLTKKGSAWQFIQLHLSATGETPAEKPVAVPDAPKAEPVRPVAPPDRPKVTPESTVVQAGTLEDTLSEAARKVSVLLDEFDRDLARTASAIGTTGLTGKETRGRLRGLCKRHSYAVNCATIDAKGMMVAIEPGQYKKHEGAVITKQEQVIRLLRTKKPVLSNVFKSVEGIDASDFQYPVTGKNKLFIGSVSVLFKPQDLLAQALKSVVSGQDEVWVMQRDGRILFDRDKHEIGRMLFKDPRYAKNPQLLSLGRKISAESSGTGRYEFLAPASKETVTKNARWTTAGIYGVEWRLVAARRVEQTPEKHVARPVEEKIISVGVVTKPGAAQNVCAEKFKELVEARSPYKVVIHHSAVLGPETEIIRKIQNNDVNMGIITSASFDAFVPEVRVIDYPFLFNSNEQVDRVIDGPAGAELLKRFEKAGLKGLAFSENGFRHVTNNKKPVRTVADVAGLRMRVMESELEKTVWKMLGTTPVPLGWPITKELEEGIVDGQENPLSVIATYEIYRQQAHLSLTGHIYSAHVDVANLKWFEGLPAADRMLIAESMKEAAKYQRAWNRENIDGFLAKIGAGGMIIEEKPDRESFMNRLATLKDQDIYGDPAIKALLYQFIDAVKP